MNKMSVGQKCYMILTDKENVYNTIYVIISIISFIEPLMYAVL